MAIPIAIGLNSFLGILFIRSIKNGITYLTTIIVANPQKKQNNKLILPFKLNGNFE